MSRIRVTKEFSFEMAHALDGHDGKCHNLHGHTYGISVTFIGEPQYAPGTPKDGMVIDFTDLKHIVKNNIVDVYDHALVLRKDSRFLKALNSDMNERLILTDYQPTCENLILAFVEIIQEKLQNTPGVELHSVRLRETLSSYAEWYASDN